MSKIMESFRKYAGKTLSSAGLGPAFRKIYLNEARQFASRREKNLSGAWIRRSTVTPDFIPLLSDIDLTCLISQEKLEELYRARIFRGNLLVKDIQIVSDQFLGEWLRCGGIRNRQVSSWISLLSKSPVLKEPSEEPDEIIAFEIAQEAYLLYHQLEPRLSSPALDLFGTKLVLEFLRLMEFWKTRKTDVLLAPRITFQQKLSPDQALKLIDSFASELKSKLASPMSGFKVEPLMKETVSTGSWLHLKMKGKNVFLLKDVESLSLTRNRQNTFLITDNLLTLFKGIGVQEQALLNSAAKTNSYYKSYNAQRLAHDLIGALLLDPDDKVQLYYCFRNIEDFLKSQGESIIPFLDDLNRNKGDHLGWEDDLLLAHAGESLKLLKKKS